MVRDVHPSRQFVGERLLPAFGTGDAAAMSHGEPGLPRLFSVHGRTYEVLGVLEKWKSTGPCRSGADEVYLRKHWYKVLTRPAAVMTIYCDRQARDRKHPKARWWVFTVEEAE
jgi:hypothetical protein